MIKFWCDSCGSDNLDFDALVTWQFDSQSYDFQAFGERAWCNECFVDVSYSEGTADQHQQFLQEMEDKAVW